MHELKKQISKDLQKLILLYLGIVTIFAASFYKDPFLENIIRATGFYLFFVVPPYLWYATSNPENFGRELIFYIGIYLGVVLISSYYLAIAGLNLSYHYFVLPFLFVCFTLLRARHAKPQRAHPGEK